MKKVKFFSYALAVLMLGACSSEEIVESGAGSQWNSEGKGYINFAIKLPTQPSTRVSNSNNDQFNDGTSTEYDVKDATLILFTGAEDDADENFTVNSAYSLDLNFYTEDPQDNQISTTTKITQQINKLPDNVVIKALVVLNNNGLFSVNPSNQLQIEGSAFTGTLSDLNEGLDEALGKTPITTTSDTDGKGLLMANAVMANSQGGTVTPTNDTKKVGPLMKIDPTKIKPTKAEAEADPAANIYVERAAAKVTVKIADNQTITTSSQLPFTIAGWALDNTNKTSKLVRTGEGFDDWKSYASSAVTEEDKYRMIGGTQIASGLYRTYWDQDYNYSTESSSETGLSTVGGATATIDATIPANGTTPGYCYENTTDLGSMTERNLTRVILKVQFNNGNSFYTIDDNRDVIWPSEGDVKTEIATRLLTQGPNTLYDWVKANVQEGQQISFGPGDLKIKLSSGKDEDLEETEIAGKCTVTDVTLTESGKAKLENQETQLPDNTVTLANNLISLYYYKGGYSYYPIYIKHFGDDLTPWNGPAADGSTYGKEEGTSKSNFLGRYGVLRNNWYDITVNSIKGLGEPNVTEVTNDPVDKVNYYISVNINVLSWAKRTQEVEL